MNNENKALELEAEKYSYRYQLFKFFSEEHDLTLLDSQIEDIVYAVNKWQSEQSKPTDLEAEIYRKIKEYGKSLDKPDNLVYANNEVLIQSCFNKSMEIVEEVFKQIEIKSVELDVFIEHYINGHEEDTFIKDENGDYMYSYNSSTLNLKSFFKDILEDWINKDA